MTRKQPTMIKIICQFEIGKVILEIPRILFYNYWEIWGSTENAMKINQYRQHITWDTPAKLKKKFFNLNKDRFDRHEEIFNSVKVQHIYGDLTRLEYYIEYAINHWLVEMEHKRREPSEILVTEIRKARTHPKVEVLKLVRR